MDGYGRFDILNKLYGYDNSAFIEFLESTGFIVPIESHSNYPKTALSITSALNMNYISTLTPEIDGSKFWWMMNPLIDNSQTRMLLERTGYESISIATDWSITDIPSTDKYFKPYPVQLNDFERYLLQVTPLRLLTPLIEKFALVPIYSAHGKLIEYNFKVLSKISENPKPTFTFAHIIAPHPPFVFDENGNPVHPNHSISFNDANDFPGTDEQYRQSYIAQLRFINTQVEQTIKSILEKSTIPPIIILQADHGPGMLTNFDSLENTCLQERFSIFSALYLPGVAKNVIPDDITPVNLFRVIFRQYFGSDLPLLKNSFYYINDPEYIYQLTDLSLDDIEQCKLTP